MAGSDLIEISGKVLELLPNAMFRVELESNKKVILCHVSGRMRMKYIKIIAGDRVKVQVSPYDLNRGRIVFREKKTNVNQADFMSGGNKRPKRR